jgi:hypothetical protein
MGDIKMLRNRRTKLEQEAWSVRNMLTRKQQMYNRLLCRQEHIRKEMQLLEDRLKNLPHI